MDLSEGRELRTFVVQPASVAVLHCYVQGEGSFDSPTVVGRVSAIPGVRRAHLVTTGRRPDKWCLVVEPNIPAEQGNAETLRQLVGAISRRVGCDRVGLLRSLSRAHAEQGRAIDIYDWLKW